MQEINIQDTKKALVTTKGISATGPGIMKVELIRHEGDRVTQFARNMLNTRE